MGLKSFLASCVRLIKLIRKPEAKEMWVSVKISLIGLVAMGALGFVIKFLAFQFLGGTPTT